MGKREKEREWERREREREKYIGRREREAWTRFAYRYHLKNSPVQPSA